MTFQDNSHSATKARQHGLLALACSLTALCLLVTPASADMPGGGSLDVLAPVISAKAGLGRVTDCRALRASSRLRNTLRPSERRALIRECRSRQSEVRIADNPVPAPPVGRGR